MSDKFRRAELIHHAARQNLRQSRQWSVLILNVFYVDLVIYLILFSIGSAIWVKAWPSLWFTSLLSSTKYIKKITMCRGIKFQSNRIQMEMPDFEQVDEWLGYFNLPVDLQCASKRGQVVHSVRCYDQTTIVVVFTQLVQILIAFLMKPNEIIWYIVIPSCTVPILTIQRRATDSWRLRDSTRINVTGTPLPYNRLRTNSRDGIPDNIRGNFASNYAVSNFEW